ncbi:MAG: hypothetical protein JNL68_02165 [Burkholderiales bacterium]|nr:hypothetical protein [Burkholderiales bacterium]
MVADDLLARLAELERRVELLERLLGRQPAGWEKPGLPRDLQRTGAKENPREGITDGFLPEG